MEQRRPYWKVVVNLIFSLLATVLFIGVGIKMIFFFMPFVIGWFISFIANPLVCWLEKRLKIVKKLGSAIIIVAVLGLIVLLIYIGGSKIISEVSSFVQNIPNLYHQLESGLERIGASMNGVFDLLPAGVQAGLSTIAANLDKTMGDVITRISEPTVAAAGSLAMKLPSVFIAVIVTIISAYFFIAQREQVILWSKSITPKPIQVRMTMVIDNLKHAMGGYLRAQIKIMLIIGAVLLVGFWVMKVHYAVLLAILIACLDFLPLFGTGTAMLPWILYKVLSGHMEYALGLFVIYAATQLIRRVIEPKLIGDDVGMNPLLTLVFIYLGYKLGSIIGMIFAIPIGMIVINMYKAGAFDYILDDVKILIDGIMELRK